MAKQCHSSVLSRLGFGPWLAACALIAITPLSAAAQAAQDGAPRAPGSGAFGTVSRAATINSLGLNSPALKLTTAQKAKIDSVVYAYMAEQKSLDELLPIGRDRQPNQEAIRARQVAHENLTAAVAALMNDEQRKTLAAEQAKRHPNRNPASGSPLNRPAISRPIGQ